MTKFFNQKFLKQSSISISIAALIAAGLWYSQESLIGVKPTRRLEMPKIELSQQGNLAELRSAVENNKESIPAWSELASALEREYIKNKDQNILLELIQVLSEIVKRDSQNSWALLALADISFDRQVFDKAQDYYSRYLSIEKNDYEVRARYASTLIFSGDFELALKELDFVLSKQPNYFQAIAFKAITLAELGREEDSKKLATKALELAPNEEAKERFQSFLQASAKFPKPSESTNNQAVNEEQSLENFLSSHPVIGNKKFNLKSSDKMIEVLVEDFPIVQMPEFAKQSLIQKIKELKFANEIEGIKIFDPSMPKEAIEIKIK